MSKGLPRSLKRSRRGGILHEVSVPLSSAQIIAMQGAPVSLIAAPGAGKALVIDNITFRMTRGGVAFTGGGNVTIQYAGGVAVVAPILPAVVTTGGAGSEFRNVRGVVTELTPPQNTGLTITNGTAPFAAGNGSAMVHIRYRVFSV